jgi:type IV pilus assembly protein PilQ
MRVFDSRKLLMVSGLLLLTTLAVLGASSKEIAVVKDLSVNSNGDFVEVKIATSERVQYTYFELSNPRRLVVDFHGLHNDIGFKEKSIEVAGVRRVRTSYFTNKTRQATRVVFDLAESVPYKVDQDSDGLVHVLFGNQSSVPDMLKVEPKTADPVPPNLVATALPIPFLGDRPLPGMPQGLIPATGPFPVMAPLISHTVVQANPPPQPNLLAKEQPIASLTDKPTLKTPRTLTSGTAPATPAAATPTPTPPVPASVGGPGQVAPPQYTGEIVNIDVRDMDLKDFFRFIADVSGLNIVLDPSVSGAVTLTLTDVPWDQALDIVLKNHQLGSELQGNVLRIARRDTLLAEENARLAQIKAIENSVPLMTKSYILNYRKADLPMSNTLTKFLSPRGTLIPDVQRNALIVSDIPDQFVKLDDVIQFLDTPLQQVEIEARLLSANKSFSRELGNQLGVVFGNNSQNKITGTTTVGTSPFTFRVPPPSVGPAIPLNVNLPAAATSGLSFLLGEGANTLLDEIITAAEARGTAKLLSKPHVITQNNQAATISQGTQIPVQTNQNNTVSVQFLDFSLKLTATPQITNVGTIVLNVQIENSQPDFARAINGIPSVSTQQVQTSILMGDGETLVLGGILVDQDSNNIRQVPGLGSIPLIGYLFKDNQVVKSTAELLFFITPRIQSSGNMTMTPEKPPGQQQ